MHIEMAASLDTDAFLNALRWFTACRGQVKIIRSDNGTNILGAQRELRQAIRGWNLSHIESHLLQKEIDWRFNAPGASHHGGFWERLICSIRKVILGLPHEQALIDDGLMTLLAEVESILNGRPLTRCSTDPRDLDSLTPNHLLLLKDQPSLPPGDFAKSDIYARRRWHQVPHLSNVFWQRWLREYLTLLQERQKWLHPQRNVCVNDIVLVVDSTAPRSSWLIGKVESCFPDRNGVVCNVVVRMKTSTLTWPISVLVLVLEGDA